MRFFSYFSIVLKLNIYYHLGK